MKSSLAVKNSQNDDQLDLVFYALSDKTRRSLLSRLTQSEAMVSELAEPFNMSLAAVGKHLRVLERSGLVKRTVKGRNHELSFSSAPLKDIEQWLNYYRTFWQNNLDQLARFVENDETKKSHSNKKK